MREVTDLCDIDAQPSMQVQVNWHSTSPPLSTGLFWLFMGCANSDAKLYDEELQELAATYPDQFRIDYALSREQNNARGGKMYIQVRTTPAAGGLQAVHVV